MVGLFHPRLYTHCSSLELGSQPQVINSMAHVTGGALTLEGGPHLWVFMPAPLHKPDQAGTGTWPRSADRWQLWTVALHHFHHDVQNVLFICKGEAHVKIEEQGSSSLRCMDKCLGHAVTCTSPGTLQFPFPNLEISLTHIFIGHTILYFPKFKNFISWAQILSLFIITTLLRKDSR